MTTRRETLKGIAVLAAADKIADGGLAAVSLPGEPVRQDPVLPPGAIDAEAFRSACIGCGACIYKCPAKCLRPSVSFRTFGQPEMDFRKSYCRLGCVKCTVTCPVGAIRRLQTVHRPHVHMGGAVWKKDLCLRTAKNEKCTACVRKCPVRAIHLVDGIPVVDRNACIGCGACEHVCPARPQPAIFVEGYPMQRIVNPMGEADLLVEMKQLVDAGESLVVAQEGVIVLRLTGRGIGPVSDALEKNASLLKRAVVWDKIVGRAAAVFYVKAGVRKVCAHVMSEEAQKLLSTAGIAASAETLVPRINNRERTGECPMEKAIRGMADVDKMIETIRKVLEK